MKHNNEVWDAFQFEEDDFRIPLVETIREEARKLIHAVYGAEVNRLCGPAYLRQKGRETFRSGSTEVQIPLYGEIHRLARPRVRRKTTDGSAEVNLQSHQHLRRDPLMAEELVRLARLGVSTRDMKRAVKGRFGSSKSQVSRYWTRVGLRLLDEFRARPLNEERWVALLLDGVRLNETQHAIVALGITIDGKKVMLDFEIGASENQATADALTQRLKSRGFGPEEGYRLLAVMDGSAPLRNAPKKVWPDTLIQLCLVHKERNLKGYLPRRDWGEMTRLMNRLRRAEGKDAGEAAAVDLEKWLGMKNAAALASFTTHRDELLMVHRLGVPATLHTSLLSTNLIENPFRNVRRRTGRVTRFRPETNQAARWMAYALTEAERGFRRIKHAEDLEKLRAALKIINEGGTQISTDAPTCSHGTL